MLRPLAALLFAPLSLSFAQAPTLRDAAQVVADAVAADDVLGAVVLVARGDELLLHEAFGWRDAGQTRPMTTATLFRMASNTKAVTAAAVLALVGDGKLALDDAAARFVPAFAHDDAAKVTVRHLLTHTSGLRIDSLFVMPLMAKSAEHPDAPSLVREAARIGEVGPREVPGRTYAYSNAGYNVLAAIVEIASGQPFDRFCTERFQVPLGMRDTYYHETVADNARMAEVVARPRGDGVAGNDGGEAHAWRVVWHPGGEPTMPFVRGSGGLITTAADFARFCRLWLDDGRCGDRELLPAELVRQATTNQIAHVERGGYGFGWVAEGDGVFAHGGSDGTWAWCDRTRGVVGMVLTQTQGGAKLDAVCRRFRERVAAAIPAR